MLFDRPVTNDITHLYVILSGYKSNILTSHFLARTQHQSLLRPANITSEQSNNGRQKPQIKSHGTTLHFFMYTTK